jgi:hypothetical protein
MKPTPHSENPKILQILIQTTSGKHPCSSLNPHSQLTKEGLGVVDYQAIRQTNTKMVGKQEVVSGKAGLRQNPMRLKAI